jgi:hypothetical protein
VEGVAVTRVVAEELSVMLTDVPPRNANRDGFRESVRIRTLALAAGRAPAPPCKVHRIGNDRWDNDGCQTRLR